MKANQVIELEIQAYLRVPVHIPVEQDYMDTTFDLEGALEEALKPDATIDSRVVEMGEIKPTDRISLHVDR